MEWTNEQTQYLLDNFRTQSYSAIASHLGLKQANVASKAWRMKLKRTREEQLSIIRNYNGGCFYKGHAPANKGMKGIRVSPGTEFKKGNLPKNTLHDGAITIRKRRNNPDYKFIRIGKGKWELLHRYTWEQAHGPIPKKHVIAFKDGDTLNCDLSNLLLISQKDNLKRNKNVPKAIRTRLAYKLAGGDEEIKNAILEQYPELVEVKKLSIQLNKTLKQNESNRETTGHDRQNMDVQRKDCETAVLS